MIGMEITGTEAVLVRLGSAPGKVRSYAKSSLDMWATELASYIKTDKLSGQVLNRRSGRLSASVHPTADETTTSSSAGAAAGAGVPYARIHEFGGLIPAHIVVAINARALAFTVDGVTRFAKSVHIPDVQMPERSYMRSGLEDRAPSGIEGLREAMKQGMAT